MNDFGNNIKSFFYLAGCLTPNSILHLYSSRLILPTYHLVSDNVPAHIRHLYKPKTKKEFIKDLDFLLKFYKPINLQELLKISRENTPVKSNSFHLSFDDGLRECYELIAPILKLKGIPATFFINPAFIDNNNLMYRYKASILIDKIVLERKREYKKQVSYILNINYNNRNILDKLAAQSEINFNEYLDHAKPYMLSSEINSLIKDGFTIGAHSMDHPQYSHIPLEDQLKQTRQSLEYIANEFKLNYKVFAFPFTDEDVSALFFDTIYSSSESVADLTFGVAGIKQDYHPKHLQRIPMENQFSGKAVIKGEYLYNSIKKLIRKNKIQRN